MDIRKSTTDACVAVAEHEAPGYKALLETDGDWIAALMNGGPDSWSVPARLEKHNLTDELFVLVAGKGCLVIGGNNEHPDTLSVLPMKRGVLYNVKRGTWHANPMTADGKMVIVERNPKGLEADFTTREELSETQRATISLCE